MRGLLLVTSIASSVLYTASFSALSQTRIPVSSHQFHRLQRTKIFAEPEGKDDKVQRQTFDEAGKSLVDEQDQEKMDQMGDYDTNPEYQTSRMEEMRAAIQARAQSLDIEKSKVSADYIASRQAAAMKAGSAGALDESNDMFGGLDLSQINSEKTGNEWNEDMPTMFYDPEDEMTKEEQEEADPLMTKSFVEQASAEIAGSKWPGPLAAIREVGVMLVVVAFTFVVIINWDKFLREVYTGIGFIPSADDLANYANRFDGLDLPSGWMDNMDEADVAKISDKLNTL